MTLYEALELLQCNSTELAKRLDISTSAIAQWDKDKIPKLREYEIKELASKDQNEPAEPFCSPESVLEK